MPFSQGDICTEHANALVRKTASATAQIKAVAPNCTSSQCSPQHGTPAVKNNKRKLPTPLIEVLDEAVRIISFIKSSPLSTLSF